MRTIDDYRKLIDSGKDIKELFLETRNDALKYQEEFNSFKLILDKMYYRKSSSYLNGILYALKDNISTRGIETTACSNILKGYIPPYDATVYKKLKEAGCVLIGKTSMDELAMGGTGTTGCNGIVRNPYDKDRLIGGSSAGSASSVSLGIVPFSIGSDTGDSIRKPAAYGGVVGFKPTYGRISRYGLFAFASSLDHVGVFSNNVRDAAIVTDAIKGYDYHDMTSLKDDLKVYSELIDKDIKGKKLFYFKDVCDPTKYTGETKEVLIKFMETVEKVRELGVIVDEVEFDKDLLMSLYPTYMSISCAEATSNNSNLTGIQFGPRGSGNNIEEIMFDARTKGFSELIKRRFVLGSFILQKENQDKLFLNACRIRRMVVDKMNELFKEYDSLLMPASGSIAPKFDQVSDKLSDEYLILENHLVIGNFGGFPSITIPSGIVNNMPIAINITGRVKEDDVVLNIANKIEEKIDFKGGK